MHVHCNYIRLSITKIFYLGRSRENHSPIPLYVASIQMLIYAFALR